MNRFENTVGNEIRILSNLIRRRVDSSPRKMRVDEITGSNAWIIGYIGSSECGYAYQRDIEQKCGITRSTVSKVINLMVSKGFIERQSEQSDARLKKLVLTDKAWEIFKIMKDDMLATEDVITAGFSPEEKAAVIEYLHRMQRNVRLDQEEREN